MPLPKPFVSSVAEQGEETHFLESFFEADVATDLAPAGTFLIEENTNQTDQETCESLNETTVVENEISETFEAIFEEDESKAARKRKIFQEIEELEDDMDFDEIANFIRVQKQIKKFQADLKAAEKAKYDALRKLKVVLHQRKIIKSKFN